MGFLGWGVFGGCFERGVLGGWVLAGVACGVTVARPPSPQACPLSSCGESVGGTRLMLSLLDFSDGRSSASAFLVSPPVAYNVSERRYS